MFVVGEEGFTIVGLLGPETMVHSPEPEEGGTAFMVTEVNPQTPFGVVPPLAFDGAGSVTKSRRTAGSVCNSIAKDIYS